RDFPMPAHPARWRIFDRLSPFTGRFSGSPESPIGLDAPSLQCIMVPMSTIKTVCVYCGSGPGTSPHFTEGAKAFGKALAENNIRLVYGGGSLEELVEQLTWKQLGRHAKPVLLANIDNFWEPLFSLLSHMRQTEFIRAGLSVDILKADRVEDILPKLKAAVAQLAEAEKQL